MRSKLLKDDHDKLFNKDKELKEEKLKLKVYFFFINISKKWKICNLLYWNIKN